MVDQFHYDKNAGKFVRGDVGASLSIYDLPQYEIFDGDKFLGGFGNTKEFYVDYWTLRARSAQLFTENIYARGLIRRLITNEINTGLCLEATPDELVLGVPEDSLTGWSDEIEQRFHLWARDAEACDYRRGHTFAEIQAAVKLEAYVSGDVLVILRADPVTKLPNVQIVDGNLIRTPYGAVPQRGNKIVHGVEIDSRGRHVAFWITNPDDVNRAERILARGSRTGRLNAWLVYGTDKRFGSVRGQPLFSLMLQSLKEIDRYRDSVQRKAVINSMLAMFIKKTQDKMGTLPFGGGAVRTDQTTVTDADGKTRQFKIANQIPGLVMEELQTGEEPVGFHSQGVDLNFGPFEEAIVQTMAWAHETPPEILRLAFSNNYSASQAAINEFKIYLNRVRSSFGASFCQPVYEDWLLSMALLRRIEAPGLLEAWRDAQRRDEYSAWVDSDWSGAIKPSTDISKQAKGYQTLSAHGWITNDRAARELTGTKFTKNVKRLKRENELLVEAARPIAEFRREFGEDPANSALDAAVTAAARTSEPVDAGTREAIEGVVMEVLEDATA